MANIYADLIRYEKINPKTHAAWVLADVPARYRAVVEQLLGE